MSLFGFKHKILCREDYGQGVSGTMYKVVKALLLIAGILCVAVGIIYCATCKVSTTVQGYYGPYTKEVDDPVRIVAGVLFMLLGPIVCYLNWLVLRPVIGLIYDVKIIKNSLPKS